MSIAQSQKSAADADAPGTAQALLAPGTVLARLLAGAFLLAVIVFLIWGWRYQSPREDPWAPAGFRAWLLSPLPDPLYRSMPVTPGGAAGGFVPAELCSGAANPCPGLAVYGQHGLRLVGAEFSMPVVLHRLVRLPEAHRLIGVSQAGILYERMKDSVWRPLLPIAWQEPQEQDQRQKQAPRVQPLQQKQQQQRPIAAQERKPQQQATLLIHDTSAATGRGGFAVSPDGTRIGSAGQDGWVRLWTVDGKSAAEPFQAHNGMVLGLAFSPDGTRIISAGVDSAVRLWTLDGKRVSEFKGHRGDVTSSLSDSGPQGEAGAYQAVPSA